VRCRQLELLCHLKRFESAVVNAFPAEYAGCQFEDRTFDWKFAVAHFSRSNAHHRDNASRTDERADLTACALVRVYVQLPTKSQRKVNLLVWVIFSARFFDRGSKHSRDG